MSKKEKLIAKLLDDRAAFSWQELTTLLQQLGYDRIEGNGSRVKFDNGEATAMINLHRPHPGNELKRYARAQVIEKLQAGGLI
jgi:hypothetical protein